MNKIEICRKTLDLESGHTVTLIYSITIDEWEYPISGIIHEYYGVSVMISEGAEDACIQCVTLSERKAYTLIDVLAENYVTPVSLYDVVHDWLAAQ